MRKYPLVSHVSPNVEDGSPIDVSTSNSQRETCIRASRVFKFNQLHKWLLIAFCLKCRLSQIAILDGMSIIFYQSCITLGQYVWHSKLLPRMRQASNIVLLSHTCQSVSTKFQEFSLHMSLSSSMYWNFNNILSSHNFGFCESITIIAWIITRVEKLGCIKY